MIVISDIEESVKIDYQLIPKGLDENGNPEFSLLLKFAVTEDVKLLKEHLFKIPKIIASVSESIKQDNLIFNFKGDTDVEVTAELLNSLDLKSINTRWGNFIKNYTKNDKDIVIKKEVNEELDIKNLSINSFLSDDILEPFNNYNSGEEFVRQYFQTKEKNKLNKAGLTNALNQFTSSAYSDLVNARSRIDNNLDLISSYSEILYESNLIDMQSESEIELNTLIGSLLEHTYISQYLGLLLDLRCQNPGNYWPDNKPWKESNVEIMFLDDIPSNLHCYNKSFKFWTYSHETRSTRKFFHGYDQQFSLVNQNNVKHEFHLANPMHRVNTVTEQVGEIARRQNNEDNIGKAVNNISGQNTEGIFLVKKSAGSLVKCINPGLNKECNDLDDECSYLGQYVLVRRTKDKNNKSKYVSLTKRRVSYRTFEVDGLINKNKKHGPILEEGHVQMDSVQKTDDNNALETGIMFHWNGMNLTVPQIGVKDDSENTIDNSTKPNIVGEVSSEDLKLFFEFRHDLPQQENMFLVEGYGYEFLVGHKFVNGWVLPKTAPDNSSVLSLEDIEPQKLCDLNFRFEINKDKDQFYIENPISPPFIIPKEPMEPDLKLPAATEEQEGKDAAELMIVKSRGKSKRSKHTSRWIMPPPAEFQLALWQGCFEPEFLVPGTFNSKKRNSRQLINQYIDAAKTISKRIFTKTPAYSRTGDINYFPDLRANHFYIAPLDEYTNQWLHDAEVQSQSFNNGISLFDLPTNSNQYLPYMPEHTRYFFNNSMTYDLPQKGMNTLNGNSYNKDILENIEPWELIVKSVFSDKSLSLEPKWKEKKIIFNVLPGVRLKFLIGSTNNYSLNYLFSNQSGFDYRKLQKEFFSYTGQDLLPAKFPTKEFSIQHAALKPIKTPEFDKEICAEEKIDKFGGLSEIIATRLQNDNKTKIYYPLSLKGETYHSLTTKKLYLISATDEVDDDGVTEPESSIINQNNNEYLHNEYSAEQVFLKRKENIREEVIYKNKFSVEFKFSDEQKNYPDKTVLFEFNFSKKTSLVARNINKKIQLFISGKELVYSDSGQDKILTAEFDKKYEVIFLYEVNQEHDDLILEITVNQLDEKTNEVKDKKTSILPLANIDLPVSDLSRNNLSHGEEIDKILTVSSLKYKESGNFFVYSDESDTRHRVKTVNLEAVGNFANYFFNDDVKDIRVHSCSKMNIVIKNNNKPVVPNYKISPLLLKKIDSFNWGKKLSYKQDVQYLFEIDRPFKTNSNNEKFFVLLSKTKNKGTDLDYENMSSIGRDVTTSGSNFIDGKVETSLDKIINLEEGDYLKKYYKEDLFTEVIFPDGNTGKIIEIDPRFDTSRNKWIAVMSFNLKEFNIKEKHAYNPIVKFVAGTYVKETDSFSATAKKDDNKIHSNQISLLAEAKFISLFNTRAFEIEKNYRLSNTFKIIIKPESFKKYEEKSNTIYIIYLRKNIYADTGVQRPLVKSRNLNKENKEYFDYHAVRYDGIEKEKVLNIKTKENNVLVCVYEYECYDNNADKVQNYDFITNEFTSFNTSKIDCLNDHRLRFVYGEQVHI